MRPLSYLVLIALLPVGFGCDTAQVPNQQHASPAEEQPVSEETNEPMEDDWPFEDPPNVAVITLRQVLDDHEPILYVTHDAEDGQWQFLHGGDVHEDDARIVALRTIVELDPTVKELANLPLGWVATRDAVGESWRRQEE